MNYQICKKESFKVIGIKDWTSIENGENKIKIPKMWQNLSKNTSDKLLKLNNINPYGLLGVCSTMYNNGIDYWIAVASMNNHCPEDLFEMQIPASTWAIFECIGAMPNAIQDLMDLIYSNWLPSSEYIHADVPEIELYTDGDTNSPNYKSQIWIPIVKK